MGLSLMLKIYYLICHHNNNIFADGRKQIELWRVK